MKAALRAPVYELAAFLLPFRAYLAGAMPDVGLWDTGEMATVPYIFGIAHPTGFPLYVIAGFLWSHLVFFGSVAWRMAALSALCASGGAWLAYRLARGFMGAPYALFSSLLFAFGPVVWTRATRPEVHTAALLLAALAVVVAQAVHDGRSRAWWAVPLLAALGVAVHPVVIWIFPALAVLVLSGRGVRTAGRPAAARGLVVGCLAGALAFAACYATIPWRSAVAAAGHSDPTLALGFAPGMPFWDYGHPSTPAQFLWFFRGAQFAPGAAVLGLFAVPSYPAYAATILPSIYHEFPLGLAALALMGFIRFYRAGRATGIAYTLLALCGLPFAARYHIEIDSDRYLLVAYWAIAVACGLGLQSLLEFAARPGAKRTLATRSVGAALAATGAIAVGLLTGTAALHADPHEGRAVIDRILTHTPPDAVIVSSWVYATPLAYAAYVEHSLGRRVVVAADSDGISARLPALARNRPLFLIDDKVPAFSDAAVDLSTQNAEFPPLVRVRPKNKRLALSNVNRQSGLDRRARAIGRRDR